MYFGAHPLAVAASCHHLPLHVSGVSANPVMTGQPTPCDELPNQPCHEVPTNPVFFSSPTNPVILSDQSCHEVPNDLVQIT
jgi:hypothetical protein